VPKKKHRRKKLRHASPEALAARASGLLIHESREGTLIRLLDTAILDWFLERDPFAIHLLVCASYMVLADLGKNNGKGPRFERNIRRFEMEAVYDFLRHAKPDMLNDSVDFAPVFNHWLLFDAIQSFRRLFNGATCFMMTFQAYAMIRPAGIDRKSPEDIAIFLPQGLTVEVAERLASRGRVAFFTKVSEMFAKEILRQQNQA
jgi:hypothetical protein